MKAIAFINLILTIGSLIICFQMEQELKHLRDVVQVSNSVQAIVNQGLAKNR